MAGTLAKLPMYVEFPVSGYTVGDFYTRNIGFFILPVLIAFFCWKKVYLSVRHSLLSMRSLFHLHISTTCPVQPKIMATL